MQILMFFKMKKLVNRISFVALMLGSLSSYASETYFEKGKNNGVITTSKNVKKRFLQHRKL